MRAGRSRERGCGACSRSRWRSRNLYAASKQVYCSPVPSDMFSRCDEGSATEGSRAAERRSLMMIQAEEEGGREGEIPARLDNG
jgi:hypothetical protein